MSAPYDAIARDYQRTKESPLRRYVEGYTLARLLGEVRGLTILDAGCGDGHYARRLARAGARVVGVDISEAMIELAREAERREPLGIQYRCLAAERLAEVAAGAGEDTFDARFDIVLGAYLLHYAPDRAALESMVTGLARNLRPGGRFVGLVENPLQAVEEYGAYGAYGFDKSALEPRAEGSRIRYGLVSGRRMVHFDTFYYGAGTYEAILASAGFESPAWHRLEADPGVPAEMAAWFRAYLENPPVLGLTARRQYDAGNGPAPPPGHTTPGTQ